MRKECALLSPQAQLTLISTDMRGCMRDRKIYKKDVKSQEDSRNCSREMHHPFLWFFLQMMIIPFVSCSFQCQRLWQDAGRKSDESNDRNKPGLCWWLSCLVVVVVLLLILIACKCHYNIERNSEGGWAVVSVKRMFLFLFLWEKKGKLRRRRLQLHFFKTSRTTSQDKLVSAVHSCCWSLRSWWWSLSSSRQLFSKCVCISLFFFFSLCLQQKQHSRKEHNQQQE